MNRKISLRMGNTVSQFEYDHQEFQDWLPIDGELSGLTFEDCKFVNCSWGSLSLRASRFLSCRFENCDLSNIDVQGARFRDVVFSDCKLVGVSWAMAADVVQLGFQAGKLDYSSFSGLNLKKTEFARASLRDVDFSQADLSECDFRESNLLNAQFRGTKLLKADLRGAIHYVIDPLANSIQGVRAQLPEAQGFLAGLGIRLE